MQNIAHIRKIASEALSVTESTPSVVSLEDRLIHNYAQSMVELADQKMDLKSRLTDLNRLMDPKLSIRDQEDLSKHNMEMSALSTLVRKATSAIETVLRA